MVVERRFFHRWGRKRPDRSRPALSELIGNIDFVVRLYFRTAFYIFEQCILRHFIHHKGRFGRFAYALERQEGPHKLHNFGQRRLAGRAFVYTLEPPSCLVV